MAAYNFPKMASFTCPASTKGASSTSGHVPRASVAETDGDLKARDAMLRGFPEVEMVVGKSGRAETPTDPSPLEMLETVVTLRPKDGRSECSARRARSRQTVDLSKRSRRSRVAPAAGGEVRPQRPR